MGHAIVTGVLLWLSLPPLGWWPAGLLGLALFTSRTAAKDALSRAGFGATVGVVWFGASLRWLWPFTGVGVVLLVVLQAAFLALAAAVAPGGRGRLIAVPGALVLAEALRRRWPWSGLPLSGLDLGQVDGPLAALAPHGGPLGVILASALLASLLVMVARGHPSCRVVGGVVGALALMGVAVLPNAPGTADTGTLDVAVVQGGGPRGVVAVGSDPTRPYRRHLQTTKTLSPGAQVILWPEDVVDVTGRFATSAARRELANLADTLSAVLVVGVVEDAPGSLDGSVRRFRNAALAIGPDGRTLDRYDKLIRVPFGEYVPLRPAVDAIADLSLIPREAAPGPGGAPVLETGVARFGTAISYEGLFSRRVRAGVRAGAEVVLIPTNSSSFATADAPAQQLAAARMRARESGRWVLLASPTGYSAVIDATGTVRMRTALGAAEVLRMRIERRAGFTPYARFGDVPILVVALTLLAGGWGLDRRSAGRLRSTADQPGAPTSER